MLVCLFVRLFDECEDLLLAMAMAMAMAMPNERCQICIHLKT